MATTDDAPQTADIAQPIIIDMGKVKKKAIKRLKKGRGKLMVEVGEVVGQVLAEMGTDVEGKKIVPIVVIYRKKDGGNNGVLGLGLPFIGL